MLGQSFAGKKIAITGGSGFLGSYVVPELLKSGAKITCLCRSMQNIPDVEIVKGDCRDGAALKKLLKGQDILIHMAALLFGSSWQDYLKSNTRAAQCIAETAKIYSPEKVIYVSSLAAAGPCGIEPGLDESAIPAPVSAYGWSKLICENILLSHFGEKLVIIRPPIIYGAGDRGLLPMFRSVRKGFGVSPGAFRKFPVSIIHAHDCSQAIKRCCAESAKGVYHLSDETPCNMDIFCNAMAAAMGKSHTRILHVPLSIMQISAACCSTWSMATNWAAQKLHLSPPRPPHWNMDKMREAKQSGWLADSRRIAKELGFKHEMDLNAGMTQAVAGYQERGWL